ncbi:DNA-binding beta-propeller fold protein YncE [Sphingomonas aurantiaca]|uniref:DNA-binding beta-propeller fold protein YncE n=1 Tax=Sphingomonas aurantiaca TaxID=185949 RepID=A0A2T5GH04_9SPHN|nr:YncE family protein [Sphingomonas aurantiaca]PTQ58595.1 DNA-binding beta-propeller fold protein YncE [Sphingomonas aurantiaca]
MKAAIVLVAAMLASVAPVPAIAQAYWAAPAADDFAYDINAVQAPWSKADIDVSHHDRIYVSDPTSTKIVVIDPAAGNELGRIDLSKSGMAEPSFSSPNVQRLAAARDGRTVATLATRSVTLLDLATNTERGRTVFETSPTAVAFTPNGHELWVSLGDEYAIAVVDPKTAREITRVPASGGAGATILSPDGRYAFVSLTAQPSVLVVDVAHRRVVGHVASTGAGAGAIAVSPDGKQIWATRRDSGTTTVFAAKPPFAVREVINTGPATSAVNFAQRADDSFAYVGVGGDQPGIKVYRTDSLEAVTTVPLQAAPTAVWPSGDGTRIYASLAGTNKVAAIDTLTYTTASTIPISTDAQSLIYVPGAVRSGKGLANLVPSGRDAALALAAR